MQLFVRNNRAVKLTSPAQVLLFDVADRENLQYQVIEQTKDHVVVHKDHPIRDTFQDIFLKNEGESQVEQTKK